jgi:hypothetical protein
MSFHYIWMVVQYNGTIVIWYSKKPSWDGILWRTLQAILKPPTLEWVHLATTPQRHRIYNHFEWFAHERSHPLQGPLHWHMHQSIEQNRMILKLFVTISLVLIEFVETIPMLPSLCTFHISHVPISWHSKWPHLEMGSHWTRFEHYPSMLLHLLTYQRTISLEQKWLC